MVPTAGLPLVTPFTSQVTNVLLKFNMVPVHCTVPFTFTEELAQAAVMLGAAAVLEPQEFKTSSAGTSMRISREYPQRAFCAHIYPFG